MSWFSYVFKTSLKQKKQDWEKYTTLKQNLENAQGQLDVAKKGLEKLFEEDADAIEYNACIKRRILFVHIGRDIFNRLNGYEYCTTITSRCTEFAPVGDEKLCNRYMCEAHYKNEQYFEALQKFKQAEQEYKNFWNQKVNQK